MNSEISNVLKLVPVAAVKVDKQENVKTPVVDSEATKPEVGKAASQIVGNQGLSVASTKADENKQSDKELTLELAKKAAEEGNSLLQATRRNLQFMVDDSTKEVVVKIVDSDSGELVRQIPSEEMLNFIKRMQELQGEQGSVIQDRA